MSTAIADTLTPVLESLPERLPTSGITAIVHRSLLLNHPLNPRKIDQFAAGALLDSIRHTGGLVDDPIWNRRNGFLVGGHQRLSQEDKRRGTQNYLVSVKVVDWDETKHKEVMTALNNPNIQGRYEIDLIDMLVKEPDFSFVRAGFDQVSLEDLYLQNGVTLDWNALAGGEEASEVDPGTVEAVAAADDVALQIEEADAARLAEREWGEAAALESEKIKNLKDRRQEYKQEVAFKCDTGIAVSLVFPTTALKGAFLKFLGKPAGEEKLDGIGLAKVLKLDVPEFAGFMANQTATTEATKPPVNQPPAPPRVPAPDLPIDELDI